MIDLYILFLLYRNSTAENLIDVNDIYPIFRSNFKENTCETHQTE